MRITNRMITTQYNKSLNKLSYELNKLNTRVASGRKFDRSSENTPAAMKAFQIRKDMSRLEGYQAGITHAKASLSNAESTLFQLEEQMQVASSQILFGINGTQNEESRSIIASELRNIQEQLLQGLNSNASDTYYFGGTNTSTRPFTVVDGKLHYNGYDLSLPLPAGTPDENAALLRYLEEDSMYVDIGLNVQFDEVTGKIDESSVFAYSIQGISIAGSGSVEVDGEIVGNNLYDLLGAIIDTLESEDYSYDRANALFGHFKDAQAGISRGLTRLGAKTSYLDFMKNRIDDMTFNLQSRQVETEGADPAQTIIEFEAQKLAYAAALQMGNKLIQHSIFDYMT